MGLCGRALADPSRGTGADVEPIWAGPSLPAIFLDKNAETYCGYSGPDSLADGSVLKQCVDEGVACGAARGVTRLCRRAVGIDAKRVSAGARFMSRRRIERASGSRMAIKTPRGVARCGAVTSTGGLAALIGPGHGGGKRRPRSPVALYAVTAARLRSPSVGLDCAWLGLVPLSCGKATAPAAGYLRPADARSAATRALRYSAQHHRGSSPRAWPGCSTADAARRAFRY